MQLHVSIEGPFNLNGQAINRICFTCVDAGEGRMVDRFCLPSFLTVKLNKYEKTSCH
jgi:hypothetical protein